MKFIQIIFLLFIVMASCTQQQSSEIEQQVDQLIDQQIKDKRLAYCNVEVSDKDGQPAITGATVSKATFDALYTFATEKGVDFSVELLPSEDFKENKWAIVTLSVCNIRGNSRHSAEMLTQAVMGTPVKVYRKKGGWYLIQTPDRYFGWVDGAGIALKTNEELADWKAFKKVLYKQQYGFAYVKPNENSSIVCDLALDNLLSVVDETNGFYKTELADGRDAFVKIDECIGLDIWYNKSVAASDVLTTAKKFMGVPYLWGGTSAKMVDCSGFVKSAYYYYGIILQRDASQQTLYGELVDTEDSYEALEAGDLVFFGRKASGDQRERVTHVGLCLGDQEFIHASGKVRVNSLDRNSEKYTEHYEKGFVRARRVLENIDGNGIEWVVDNPFFKQILPE
ncbi:C40 family peptidase [Draconibacterium halophilum]|uniref:C40 family peptidase n=1 Tax=Draconibacterium halophilum TaxID=2706887 RepID=A0A6C0RC27_9BACT|nr:C40 family peptidase [Draconibacterium halophilum]QIA07880.1 C40 family peptidase [Draconibacterium halophilum]